MAEKGPKLPPKSPEKKKTPEKKEPFSIKAMYNKMNDSLTKGLETFSEHILTIGAIIATFGGEWQFGLMLTGHSMLDEQGNIKRMYASIKEINKKEEEKNKKELKKLQDLAKKLTVKPTAVKKDEPKKGDDKKDEKKGGGADAKKDDAKDTAKDDGDKGDKKDD